MAPYRRPQFLQFHPEPSSLIPDRRPSSLDIYSRVRFGHSRLVTYFTLVVPIFIYSFVPKRRSQRAVVGLRALATLALLPNFWHFIGPTRLSYTFDWLINTSQGISNIQCRSRYSYLHNDIITCSNLGSLVPPCTHKKGPRSPQPFVLFT